MNSTSKKQFIESLIGGGEEIVILDVGTHLAEEIKTLYSPLPRQLFLVLSMAVKNIIRKCLLKSIPDSQILPSLGVLLRVLFQKRAFAGQLICIDPNWAVATAPLLKLSSKMNLTFFPVAVRGHDQNGKSGFLRLFQNERSLSSSLYQKSSDSQFSLVPCHDFEDMLDAMIASKIIVPSSKVVLRLNCEGSELSVLRAVAGKRKEIHLIGVLGSIGDLGKIHGEAADCEALELIARCGAEYIYFKGDVPNTWNMIFENTPK